MANKKSKLTPRVQVAVNLMKCMDALLCYEQCPSLDLLHEAIIRARKANELIAQETVAMIAGDIASGAAQGNRKGS